MMKTKSIVNLHWEGEAVQHLKRRLEMKVEDFVRTLDLDENGEMIDIYINYKSCEWMIKTNQPFLVKRRYLLDEINERFTTYSEEIVRSVKIEIDQGTVNFIISIF